MGAATAFEIKFEGVPCQEMGRVVASSARYLIALLVLTMSNKNRCLGNAGGVSIEKISDKRVGWLWRSLSKCLFHTAFISPHSADHRWTLQYFVTTWTFQPISSPEASPGLFSNHCFWCSPLVTDSRGYQGFTFPLSHCCLLKLFQGLSRPNFSPFEPSPIFSGGYHGRILTTCRLFDS